jgi:hypothetical protein
MFHQNPFIGEPRCDGRLAAVGVDKGISTMNILPVFDGLANEFLMLIIIIYVLIIRLIHEPHSLRGMRGSR